MMPKVSIIFPTYNGWQDTKACLESIRHLKYPKQKIEVIVVDNNSSDPTCPNIAQYYPSVKVYQNLTNKGFAKAVNLGAKEATGQYLLITNNDVVFDRNYLTVLVNYLVNHPAVGAVGGKIYLMNHPQAVAFAGAKFNFMNGMISGGKTPDRTSRTDWVSGCNLLVKKELFTKLHGFDEKYFFYFEDLDFCLRAKKLGLKIIYYPPAKMWHKEGLSIDRLPSTTKSAYYYEGKTRLLFKHASFWQRSCSLIFQFMIGLPYHFLVLKHNHYRPAIRALKKNINLFHQL